MLCGGYSHHAGYTATSSPWHHLLKISAFSTVRSYVSALGVAHSPDPWLPVRKSRWAELLHAVPVVRAPRGQRTVPLSATARYGAPAGRAPLPDRHASLQPTIPLRLPPKIHVDLSCGPPRLDRAPQASTRPLVGCTALRFRVRSATGRTRSAENRKHELGQADGQFQSKNPTAHSTYLIRTAKNFHRGPLSRSGSDVPAQQLSRYAAAAVWPAGRRPDDNLPAAGQPNSRVRARRCIQRPDWVRWA
eukprot:COSAG02_NODE_12190_length_1582_cov_3.150371_1_plen_246_part_10